MLLFRHHVIKNLLAAGQISQTPVDILDRFHHPGFSAYEGEGVSADNCAARERLAFYLVHAPISLAHLHYDRDAGGVTYDPRTSQHSHLSASAPERLSPLDALAPLTAFIPEKGLQLARHYGYYSNKAPGQRRRQDTAAFTPMPASCPDAPQNDHFRRFCRCAWARLIRKVYLVDPLTCPKCGGPLRILSFIDNPGVIEKIRRHLKIWDPPERPRPPHRSTTLEPDADFLDWAPTARQSDAID